MLKFIKKNSNFFICFICLTIIAFCSIIGIFNLLGTGFYIFQAICFIICLCCLLGNVYIDANLKGFKECYDIFVPALDIQTKCINRQSLEIKELEAFCNSLVKKTKSKPSKKEIN